jgi:Outer membrane protein beta-barrel domain
MKKKILLSLSLFLSVASFAQIKYGVAAGVSSYSINGNAADNLKQVLSFTNGIVTTRPVTGFYGGGYANIPLADNFSIEPGVYYSTKGYALTGAYTIKGIDILTADATAKLNSSYIEMPLLLKGNFNGLQIFAGPQLSYLTNASLNTRAGFAGINLINSKMDVTNQLNRLDIGVTGGVGYQFSNGLRITGSYERGLSKVDAGQNVRSYNQGFKIGAGISF